VSEKTSIRRQGEQIPSCVGLTACNASEKPGDRDAPRALPSSLSQVSILSTGLPQNKSVIPLEGSDLTDLDQVFCNDVRRLPVNSLSRQDYEQYVTVLHWLLVTGFLVCFSSVPHYVSRFLLLICCNSASFANYDFSLDWCSSRSCKNYSALLISPQDTFPSWKTPS